MSNLVPEVITDILHRLPVKSLLRFRCIYKPWCLEIDSPYFIKLHLNHSLKTNSNLSIILSNINELFSLDFDTLYTAIKLNNPIFDDGTVTQVVGSCNGLVALYNYHHDMALWNPSTTKYHKLSVTPIEIQGGLIKFIDYGFGYDPVSDDYKLVRIVLYCCWDDLNLIKSEVKVYSLKLNSWKQTRDFPYHKCYERLGSGTLVNDTLHWKTTTKSERDYVNLIVSFDLRVEEYFEVPQSDCMNNHSIICVGSLGGCLCLLCGHDAVIVDIWVMKEHGVKDSWTKLFSMIVKGYWCNKPLAYMKSGDRVLLYEGNGYDDKFVRYDLRRKRAKRFRIKGASKAFEAQMCVASLVPLGGGCGTNAMEQQAPVKRRKTSVGRRGSSSNTDQRLDGTSRGSSMH